MLKFVKVNEPENVIEAEILGSEYAYKNLAITFDGVRSLCEVNAHVLKEALINSPELLAKWGLKLVPLELKTEPKPKKKTKTEPVLEVEEE